MADRRWTCPQHGEIRRIDGEQIGDVNRSFAHEIIEQHNADIDDLEAELRAKDEKHAKELAALNRRIEFITGVRNDDAIWLRLVQEKHAKEIARIHELCSRASIGTVDPDADDYTGDFVAADRVDMMLGRLLTAEEDRDQLKAQLAKREAAGPIAIATDERWRIHGAFIEGVDTGKVIGSASFESQAVVIAGTHNEITHRKDAALAAKDAEISSMEDACHEHHKAALRQEGRADKAEGDVARRDAEIEALKVETETAVERHLDSNRLFCDARKQLNDALELLTKRAEEIEALRDGAKQWQAKHVEISGRAKAAETEIERLKDKMAKYKQADDEAEAILQMKLSDANDACIEAEIERDALRKRVAELEAVGEETEHQWVRRDARERCDGAQGEDIYLLDLTNQSGVQGEPIVTCLCRGQASKLVGTHNRALSAVAAKAVQQPQSPAWISDPAVAEKVLPEVGDYAFQSRDGAEPTVNFQCPKKNVIGWIKKNPKGLVGLIHANREPSPPTPGVTQHVVTIYSGPEGAQAAERELPVNACCVIWTADGWSHGNCDKGKAIAAAQEGGSLFLMPPRPQPAPAAVEVKDSLIDDAWERYVKAANFAPGQMHPELRKALRNMLDQREAGK